MALSSLELEMSMNLARLQADAGKATRIVEGMSRDFKRLIGGLSLAYVAHEFKSFIDRTITAADNMNDLRTRTGLAGQELLILQGAAIRGGTTLEAVSDTVSKLSKRLGAVELGSGEAARGFAAIGMSAARADGSLKNVSEIMREAGEKFSEFEDGMDKSTLAIAMFGKGGDKLIPVIQGIKETEDRFKKLGIAIDEDFITAADRYKDTLADLDAAHAVFARMLVAELLPYMQQYQEVMIGMATNTDTMHNKVSAIVNPLKGAALTMYAAYKVAESLANALVAVAFAGLAVAKVNLFDFAGAKLAADASIIALKNVKNSIVDIGAASDRLFPNGAGPAFPKAPFGDDANWMQPGERKAPKLPGTEPKGKSAYQTAIEQLEKQAIKVDDLSVRMEILHGIEKGHYGKLFEWQKANLEQKAMIVDQILEETKAKKADADAMKYLQEEAQKLENLADKWRDLADPMRERNRLLAEGNELARIRKLTPEQVRIGSIDAEIRGILQAKTLQEKLDEAWNAGKITLEEYQRVLESMNKETENATNLAHELGMTFSSAFEDAMSGGKSFRDILKGIEKDLLRLGTRKLVTEPMLKWFERAIPTSSSSGGGWLGSLMNMIGIGGSSYGSLAGAAGGAGGTALSMDMFRANGGPVSGGRSYVVGEEGPELFTPAMSGNITPNGSMGMTVNNVFYLNTPADKRTQDQIAARTGQSVQRAIARNT